MSRRACQGRDALSKKEALGCWGGRGEAFRGSSNQWFKTKTNQKNPTRLQPESRPGQQVFRVSASRLNENAAPGFVHWTRPHPGTRNFLGCGYS